MGKRKHKKTVRKQPSLGLLHRIHASELATSWREVMLIITVALSAFMLFALMTYHRLDPAWSHVASTHLPANIEGVAGAWLADVLFHSFGCIAYLLPFLVLYHLLKWLGYSFASSSDHTPATLSGATRLLGLAVMLIALCGLASLHVAYFNTLPVGSGGILGVIVGDILSSFFSRFGASLILLALLLSGFVLFTHLSWLVLVEGLGRFILQCFAKLRGHRMQAFKTPNVWPALKSFCVKLASRFKERRQDNDDASRSQPSDSLDWPVDTIISEESKGPSILYPAYNSEKEIISAKMPLKNRQSDADLSNPKPPSSPSSMLEKSAPLFSGQPITMDASGAKQMHDIPSLSLLNLPDRDREQGYTAQELKAIAGEVERCLKDYNVNADVVAVHPGPVVTRFELKLAAGTKASKITGLSKDLARSLSVISVRVVEVIPGKSVVGFEVPNKHRKIVFLREVLATEQYKNARSPLTLALGKDIAGHPVIVDLAKMPHLLVAGTTGSGKSVGLNTMLLSLLYKSTPEALRLILIDPKMLELSVYDGIPHLLTPVVTDMKEAANALRWCVAEMERRYRLMAAFGVRNIRGYNQKIREANSKGAPLLDPLWKLSPDVMGGDEGGEGDGTAGMAPPLVELPYIMVLIDEFADMMMVVGKKVEELIARIAQKARAAGIHLVLAPQRPSVDVITGLIKANVPTRIAFQVSSKIDSRTILDQQGAEQLLGHGDMLYTAPGTGVPMRVHGAFVDENEIGRLVTALKAQSSPHYDHDILNETESEGGNSGSQQGGGLFAASNNDGEGDALYDQAVAIVTKTRKASISGIQRRLKIGFNRAARLIESMEAAGVVSEVSNSGTRDVLAPPPVED